MTFFGPDIRNGLPIGLGSTAGFGRRTFTPSVLFAAGEQGAWYDPTDIPLQWRRNLLTYTEQFDNAAWSKGASSVTQNTAVAPDGTTTADTLVDSAVDTSHSINQTITTVASTVYQISIFAKPASGTRYLTIGIDGASTHYAAVTFDVSAGTVTQTLQSNYSSTAGSIAVADQGYYRCQVTTTLSATAATALRIGLANSGTYTPFSRGLQGYIGDGTSGVYVWGAQLETGSTASAYQRIVTPEISFLEYDPQPVLYTDSAGTTPVTAVEQAVGLILDKSKGLVLGANLVTNGGPFTDTTGWTASNSTLSVASGKLRVSGVGSGNVYARAIFSFTTVIGRWYEFSASSYYVSGASTQIYIQKSDNTAGNSNAVSSDTNATAGNKIIRFSATATTTYILLTAIVASSVIDWDNISVRELAGNHAIQPTSASRPTLRARYNLLTYSEQFDNAAWVTINTSVSANSIASPTGTTTADTVTDNTTSAAHRIHQVISTSAASQTFSVYVKANTHSYVQLLMSDGSTGWFTAVADLSTGTISQTANGAAGTLTSSAISDVGNSWYRVSITGTAATADNARIAFAPAASGNSIGSGGSILYVGTGTSFYVWGADLRRSNDTYLPYQRIAAATDYNTVGFPPYLAFDGSDDSLYTSSIDFSATDKMTVFAGVTKLSDGAQGAVAELSATIASNNGSFLLSAPNSAAANYNWSSKGTTQVDNTVTTYTAPLTSVLTGQGDIAAPVNVIRVDGVQAGSVVTTQGTGNYSNAPLYIGRRNNATLPFNGRLAQLIVRGATTSAALITQAERWIAGKQGRVI